MEKEAQKSGEVNWGCVVLGVVIVGLGLSLIVPTRATTADKRNQMKATNNCRQIIMALKAYAADHGGAYPTGATANAAFRELVKEGILEEERIFGCPGSPFLPDGNVGVAPAFEEAVAPGENHWMLVDGLNDKSDPTLPVVFENAVDATWPPGWDTTLAGQLKRGAPWRSNKVVIGVNDGSVSVERLEGRDAHRWTAAFMEKLPVQAVLDIEEAGR